MANSKNTTVSDEQIIAALLQSGTQKAAAEAVGVDVRTIYNRMNTGEFMALYQSAKAEMLRAAVVHVNSHISQAIDAIAEIMTDYTYNPSIRLQAAQTLLNCAGKLGERLQVEEREAANQREANSIMGGIW